jgi:hypothetical protein
MDEDSANADYIRSRQNSSQSISQETLPDSSALKALIHGQPRQHNHRHRVLRNSFGDECSPNSLRKAGISRGGASRAALNSRHFPAGRTNRVRPASAISAAAWADLTMNSVSFTCCNLAACTSMALTGRRTRRSIRASTSG